MLRCSTAVTLLIILYPKRWHTVIGLTGCGKTTFALWHIKAALDAGGHIIYLHFEETDPEGVIDRLQGMGVDAEVIGKQFHWAYCDKAWTAGEMPYRITQLEQPPTIAVLDGINAACSQHGWKVGEPEAIGAYRGTFVTPLVKAGAAVLSLGHPPKGRDRQNEMHGFGSTGWLDEVDGIGFRMVASKAAPMMTGANGYSPSTSSKTDTAKSNDGATWTPPKNSHGSTWARSSSTTAKTGRPRFGSTCPMSGGKAKANRPYWLTASRRVWRKGLAASNR